jgi:hypothetical protein
MMKRGSSVRRERTHISSGGNTTVIKNSKIAGGVHSETTYNFHGSRRSIRVKEYPAGSIGSNLLQRNYIRYLVEHYNRFRQTDSSFGRSSARFSYAVIFKNIERHFKAQTYFLSDSKFDELVEFLQHRIDRTILGKRNRARQIPNYLGPEEFAEHQRARPALRS